MLKVDDREYNLNSLTMTKWKFFFYKLGLSFKKLIKNIAYRKTYSHKKYEFTTGWSGFNLVYTTKGYDNKSHLHISLIWGQLFLFLSKNEKEYVSWEYDDISKKYGISRYGLTPSIFIYYGKKYKIYNMPWIYEWIRTSVLLKDGTCWEHETKGNRKEFWREDIYGDKIWKEEHPYTYRLKNGKVQKVIATITVEEREWRRKWTSRIKLFPKIIKSINVKFSEEIGEETGSYKGGVIETGYNMLKDETPLQTLRRMEENYKC